MPRLDATDIQGFVLRGYNLPVARFLFLRLSGDAKSLALIDRLTPHVTTGEKWDGGKPASTLNVAFTYKGLCMLDLPPATLQSFPVEFVQGMQGRNKILYDIGRNDPANWDKMWLEGSVHVWLAVNADSPQSLEQRCAHFLALLAQTGGAEVIGQQDAAALVIDGKPTPKEHFGYTDGFANPDYLGVDRDKQPGQGKLNADGTWSELATGELLLGYADEAGELPVAPVPHLLGNNGSFMVYRKLHQNVKSFRDYLAQHDSRYAGGKEKLAAKFVGRWRDGTPVELSPEKPDLAIVKNKDRNVDFTFGQDLEGQRCPFSAHVRRANPRDAFGFNGALVNRRRISRRGLPYGPYAPETEPVTDQDERGIVFMALNASLFRQFEFVQQQWIEYGNDARQGNDKDALLGNHSSNHEGSGRFMIPGADDGKNPPFVCGGLPNFVELRGGDYFFLPSITALRLLATGNVDPR
jgi:Dyp-type peroxidase family